MNMIPLPLIVLTGALGAFSYLIGIALELATVRLLVKALPVLALAAWVWPRADKRIAFGLLAGAVGDIFLALPDSFLFGMIAFAIGHSFYVWAFLGWGQHAAIALAIPVAIYVSWSLSLMLGGTGPLTLPVIVYVGIIGTMIWRAAAVVADEYQTNLARWSPLVGALLFGFSDTLIGIHKFTVPLPDAAYPIILTYWGGQALIAVAAVSRAQR
jgi:uncharacterized membrane protein YhhN